MGFFSKIFGGSIADPIDAIGNAVDKIFTSDKERLQAQAVLEKLRQHPGELQVELNKLEAQHRSVWVAGWRPAIGWVCAASLACFYIPQFILGSYIWVTNYFQTGVMGPYPVESGSLMELVLALLGLGVYRTVKKISRKAK